MHVQAGLTAGVLAYLTVTASWLAGALVGLAVPGDGVGAARVLASLGGYLLTVGVLAAAPFDDRALPVYALSIAVSATAVGTFVRVYAARVRDARTLFLQENNGFVVGLLLAWWGFVRLGQGFAIGAPIVLAVTLGGLEAWGRRAVAVPVEPDAAG